MLEQEWERITLFVTYVGDMESKYIVDLLSNTREVDTAIRRRMETRAATGAELPSGRTSLVDTERVLGCVMSHTT